MSLFNTYKSLMMKSCDIQATVFGYLADLTSHKHPNFSNANALMQMLTYENKLVLLKSTNIKELWKEINAPEWTNTVESYTNRLTETFVKMGQI